MRTVAGALASAGVVAPRRFWWLATGFVAWCSALVALYALHAIGCAFAWPTASLRATLIVVFVLHLIVVGWTWRNFAKARPDPAFGQTGDFLHIAIVWTTIAAFVATVLVFGPALLLTTCV